MNNVKRCDVVLNIMIEVNCLNNEIWKLFKKYVYLLKKIVVSLLYELINDGNDRECVLMLLVCKFLDGEFLEMD